MALSIGTSTPASTNNRLADSNTDTPLDSPRIGNPGHAANPQPPATTEPTSGSTPGIRLESFGQPEILGVTNPNARAELLPPADPPKPSAAEQSAWSWGAEQYTVTSRYDDGSPKTGQATFNDGGTITFEMKDGEGASEGQILKTDISRADGRTQTERFDDTGNLTSSSAKDKDGNGTEVSVDENGTRIEREYGRRQVATSSGADPSGLGIPPGEQPGGNTAPSGPPVLLSEKRTTTSEDGSTVTENFAPNDKGELIKTGEQKTHTRAEDGAKVTENYATGPDGKSVKTHETAVLPGGVNGSAGPTTVTTNFDDKGRPTTVSTQNDQGRTDQTFDTAGRLKTEHVEPVNGPPVDREFYPSGNLKAEASGNTQTEFFDAPDRKPRESRQNDVPAPGQFTITRYDEISGKPASGTSYYADSNQVASKISYSPTGNITSKTDFAPDGHMTRQEDYTPQGVLKSATNYDSMEKPWSHDTYNDKGEFQDRKLGPDWRQGPNGRQDDFLKYPDSPVITNAKTGEQRDRNTGDLIRGPVPGWEPSRY